MTAFPKFKPGVADELGFYVYLLRDPRSGKPFYVGKGVGERCLDHLAEARKTTRSAIGDFPKLDTIRAIEAAGMSVRIDVLRHGLRDHDEAFEVEASVIDALGHPGLTNATAGRDTGERGLMSIADANAKYAARRVTIRAEHRCILVRITRQFRPGMSDTELYEATRKWWPLSRKRVAGVEFALGIHGGVVRAAYVIDGWVSPTRSDIASDRKRVRRVGFVGHRDAVIDECYLDGDVTAYLPKKGAQFPVNYVNC